MMKQRRQLIENIFSMVTLRGMEYVLAFLLVPYLLRTLGPENYGAIAFMQGIISYFNLAINYGFNLTAPKDIALAEREELPRIFSEYFWGTFFLFLLCSVVFGIGYFILNILFGISLDIPLFFACYMTAVGGVVFPVWFFQGIQEMRYITILNLLGRLITMALLFYLIQSPKDYIKAAFLQSCTTVFAGLFSWYIIYKNWPRILRTPMIKDVWTVYKKGWRIFLSSVAVNLYTSSDVVILGALTNPVIVGYYSGSEKLINCIRRGVGAVSDAIYPYITQKLKDSPSMAYQFLRKQLLFYAMGGIFLGLIVIHFSPAIVPWLLGDQYISSIEPLQIMAFVPFMVAVSTVFGYETMLPLGLQQIYSRVLIAASLVNLALIVPAILWKGALGVAGCVMITETFITVVMGVFLCKKRILLN